MIEIKEESNKGIQHLEKEANQGNAESNNQLGIIHFKEKDFKKAIHYFKEADRLGSIDASYNLGKVKNRSFF